MTPSSSNRNAVDIVGIGVSVWDSVMLVDRYPEKGTVQRASRQISGIGGGITVAIASASYLGRSAAMIDCLGDDPTGDLIVAALARAGVATDAVARERGRSSSQASIWSDRSSADRTIVFAPGSASDALQWSTQIERLVREARILHFNGRHEAVCLRAIEVARQEKTLISFDGGAFRYRPSILPMLRSADIAIVAAEFAQSHFRSVTGSNTPQDAERLCEFLRQDLGSQLIGVTAGHEGSFVIAEDGQLFHQPAVHPRLAVDTTGCGDTYHGAFLAALVGNASPRTAARHAAEIASLNARGLGGLAFPFTSP